MLLIVPSLLYQCQVPPFGSQLHSSYSAEIVPGPRCLHSYPLPAHQHKVLMTPMVIGKVPWCLSFLHGRRSPAAASKVSVHKGTLQQQETQQPRHSHSPFDCLPGKEEAHLCQFWSCETQRQDASIGPGSAGASCPWWGHQTMSAQFS